MSGLPDWLRVGTSSAEAGRTMIPFFSGAHSGGHEASTTFSTSLARQPWPTGPTPAELR